MEGSRERREERTKKKEKANMFGNRRERKEDKQPIEKGEERIVKGGQEREEGENRKHSVCKSQIKSISVPIQTIVPEEIWAFQHKNLIWSK